MSDLISRQAVIDRINKQREHLHPDTDTRDFIGDYAYKICIEFIERMPSAQPDIIRCKDCKHLQKWRSEESAKKFGQIYECVRNVLDRPKLEDFCSHAERRT